MLSAPGSSSAVVRLRKRGVRTAKGCDDRHHRPARLETLCRDDLAMQMAATTSTSTSTPVSRQGKENKNRQHAYQVLRARPLDCGGRIRGNLALGSRAGVLPSSGDASFNVGFSNLDGVDHNKHISYGGSAGVDLSGRMTRVRAPLIGPFYTYFAVFRQPSKSCK